MTTESRVETLNVLAPLCRRLKTIIHHSAIAKIRHRAPLSKNPALCLKVKLRLSMDLTLISDIFHQTGGRSEIIFPNGF